MYYNTKYVHNSMYYTVYAREGDEHRDKYIYNMNTTIPL